MVKGVAVRPVEDHILEALAGIGGLEHRVEIGPVKVHGLAGGDSVDNGLAVHSGVAHRQTHGAAHLTPGAVGGKGQGDGVVVGILVGHQGEIVQGIVVAAGVVLVVVEAAVGEIGVGEGGVAGIDGSLKGIIGALGHVERDIVQRPVILIPIGVIEVPSVKVRLLAGCGGVGDGGLVIGGVHGVERGVGIDALVRGSHQGLVGIEIPAAASIGSGPALERISDAAKGDLGGVAGVVGIAVILDGLVGDRDISRAGEALEGYGKIVANSIITDITKAILVVVVMRGGILFCATGTLMPMLRGIIVPTCSIRVNVNSSIAGITFAIGIVIKMGADRRRVLVVTDRTFHPMTITIIVALFEGVRYNTLYGLAFRAFIPVSIGIRF